MFIPRKFPTFYGSRLAVPPAPIVIPDDPAAALEFASRVDRESDALLAEGRVFQAERLAHLALEARLRAGARA
jgi:hypothetical protein